MVGELVMTERVCCCYRGLDKSRGGWKSRECEGRGRVLSRKRSRSECAKGQEA